MRVIANLREQVVAETLEHYPSVSFATSVSLLLVAVLIVLFERHRGVPDVPVLNLARILHQYPG